MAETPPPTQYRELLGTFGAVLLGLVLLVAAWTKLLDPLAFAEQIRTEGLDFWLSATLVAYIALALEVGLGLALILGLRRTRVLIPVTVLVVFFLFLTGRTYWLDSQGLLEEGYGCGCFGNLADRTPAEAFWQDLLLLVPPLLLAWWGRPRQAARLSWIRPGLVAVAVVGALVFAVKAPDLPLDDLATRLSPGVEISGLCTGEEGENQVCLDLIVPEATEGRHVVILADLPEAVESFSGSVQQLNENAIAGTGPRPWVVADITPEEKSQLFWQWGPAFEIREAPAALLRSLYRTLPRSFLVEDGEVLETWSGMPPLERLRGAPVSDSGTS